MKSLFWYVQIWIYMSLPCCYVLSAIMYMGICMCDGSLAWARICIEFSMNEKVDFSKWNFWFIRFCIGGHLLKLCGGYLLRLYGAHLFRARAPQSAMHGVKCHNCRICISLKENEKVWKRKKKEIFMNLFTIFPKDHGISSICIMYKYVCILV